MNTITSGDCLIGLDVGTTAVKGSLFDLDGKALRSFAETYPTRRSAPSIVEQDPDDWMRLLLAALRQLSEGIDAKRILAVGLTSQVNTHVFVDDRGKALMPAIVWQDGRCAAEAALLDAQISTEKRIGWWGAPLPIDASHPMARMAHVKQHAPELWARTARMLAPKDYCLLHLTGETAADAMTNFGLLDGQLQPIPEIVGLVDGAEARLPPIRGFATPIGRIRPGLPCAGAMMVTGTMDAWAGMFGAGCVAEGEAFSLSGTSEILGIISHARVPVPGVIAFAECEGIVLHAGPTQSGGASIHWLARLLSTTPEGLSTLAAVRDRTKAVPIFLPHLQGERAPLWDIAARGAFAGLDGAMGPQELAASVFEGVAFSTRWLLETLEQSAAMKPATLHHAGGGAASDYWCQLRADVLQRPIRRTKHRDAGTLGAAILAAVGAGVFASIGDAVRSIVRFDHVFEPDGAEHQRLDQRFGLYKALYQDMKPWNASWTS